MWIDYHKISNRPSTKTSKSSLATPASFRASQLYVPVSLTPVTFKVSSCPSLSSCMFLSLEKSTFDPSLNHVMTGGGIPEAGQVIVRGLPATVRGLMFVLNSSILLGTKIGEKIFSFSEYALLLIIIHQQALCLLPYTVSILYIYCILYICTP